jgi:hypothetical protein
MNNENEFSRRMALVGGTFGILAILDYFYSATGVLPTPSLRIGYPIFWLFGPMLVVGAYGLYHFFLWRGQRSVLLELGRMFMILAGAMVCLMGTMQAVSREHFDLLGIMFPPDTASEALRMGFRGANSIQSGTDLAWDTFIFIGTIFNGLFLLTRPKFWKILGALGATLGVIGIIFNYSVWPANPGTAGLIDIGPLTGTWYLVAYIYMLIQYKKLRAGTDQVVPATA